MPHSCAILLLPLLSCPVLLGQASQQNNLQTILDKTEAAISLTVNGSPFHAEMKISGAKREPEYEATINIDWTSSLSHRIEVRGAGFHQMQITDKGQIQEQNEGDFYPGWLHSFVTALLDPLFVKSLLVDPGASLGGSRSSGGGTTKLCVDRNDRPGGITDEMTWSGVCITTDGQLLNAHDFSTWMDFADYKDFSGKRIARTYTTSTGSYQEVTGKLTTLRTLTAAEADGIRVIKATSAEKRIGFTFISTRDEEARLEDAKSFDWPTVREGKTEGYMIIHALTDVTGQVRETSKHNSDNPGLEEAGRQAAMGYKFKPMLVDGIPVQMEMPLVLHFTSKVADSLPVLKGAELLAQIRGCNAKLVSSAPISSDATPTHISVNEDGKLTGEGSGSKIDVGNPAVVITLPANAASGSPHILALDCQFTPLRRNGVVTYYHGDLLVVQSR